MIITTSNRTNTEMIMRAKQVANELKCLYVQRKELPINQLQEQVNDDVLVVGKNRLEIQPLNGKEPFFFHPNSSMFRVKRLQRKEQDPFITACKLNLGMSLLDCTLGMGSDSIVASFIVGEEGKVTGIEGNPYSAYVVKQGLQSWDSGNNDMNDAMRRINVIQSENLSFLQSCENDSYDVVYFDPMFEEQIEESDGIKGLKQLALYTEMTSTMIEEALRVASQRVVLKDHYKSTRFEQYGFHVQKRKSSKFHFGVIEKG